MQRYKDYAPSQFDTKGLGLEDRQNWFVLPVSRTRDSGMLDESNFVCVVKALGGESETLEIHRFGHWGPGWFEIALIHPSREAEGEKIEAALSYYPVFDEADFSEREQEAILPAWEAWGHAEWARKVLECCDCPIGLPNDIHAFLMNLDPQITLEYHTERGEKSGQEFDNDGPRFNFRYLDKRYAHFPDHYTRDDLAEFIRTQRRAQQKEKRIQGYCDQYAKEKDAAR